MIGTKTSNNLQQEKAYRNYFKQPGNCIINLEDLFSAVERTPEVAKEINLILTRPGPVKILIEGSAYENNIDVLDKIITKRKNTDDEIILIDISPRAISEHTRHIQAKFYGKKYQAIQGNINNLLFPENFIDLIISDCTVNFNSDTDQNNKTLTEIKRVLKTNKSGCLFSAVVDYKYDDPKYGIDQELIPQEKVNIPGYFYPLPNRSFTRMCWPVPYYKSLFRILNLSFIEFDVVEGKMHFHKSTSTSYRRFLLQKPA